MQTSFARKNELAEFSAYALLGILLPVVFGHLQGFQNQLLVGTAVNAVLFVSALRVSQKRLLVPIAIAPSVGAYASAVVFGQNTAFLLYFLPAIWLGNWIFMALVKRYREIIKPAFAKALLLFAAALVLVSFNAVPALFLIAMGPVQLATALSGGFVGSLAIRFFK